MDALLEIASPDAPVNQIPAQFQSLSGSLAKLKPLLIRLTFAAAAVASMGATYRSQNFTVTAPTDEMAKQVAQHAEHYRRELAISWVGHELPNWYAPCPVKVKVGQAMGAGGFTSFSFDRGASGEMEVFGWNMVVQGSLERILDSVIPHEVSHTILACHFRRPLPRWADEGAATLAEHESEKRRQLLMVKQILHTSQRIPLKQLLSMTEYPTDPQAVLSLYAQGYTLADLLVQKQGKAHYLKFLGESKQLGWERVFLKYYGYESLAALEQEWVSWIEKGCPSLKPKSQPLLAGNSRRKRSSAKDVVIRSQTPDAEQPVAAANNKRGAHPKRYLKAPRPKLVSRPSTGKQKLALTASTDVELDTTDPRYQNDGWVAIRTSGRALPAVARRPRKTSSNNASSTRRNPSRKSATGQSRTSNTSTKFPARANHNR